MIRNALLLGLGAALLSGCAVSSPPLAIVEPVTPPERWSADQGTTVPLDAAWWTAFGDQRLTAYIEQALAENVDLAIAAARVRQARAEAREARASLLPALDLNAPFFRSHSVSGVGTPLYQTSAIPSLQASYELDLWGRLDDRASAARSNFLAIQAARDTVRLAITAEVARAYINLLALDAKLAIARRTLAARTDALRLATSRTTNGYASQLELTQAQSEYQAAVKTIPQLEDAASRQQNALDLLLGRLPGRIERGPTLEAVAMPPLPAILPSELLRRRPDIAGAELRLAATDASLAAARKAFLPRLNLAVSGGAAISDAITPNPIGLWSLGGSILAPLFEGGRLKAQAESAAGRRDEAAFAYRKTALTAFKEVEDALSSVRNIDQQVIALRAQRDAQAKQLGFASNRYREGFASYLEQLDAQRGLLAVEFAVAQAQADALDARIDVYLAMGGGWSRAVLDSTQK